MANSMALGTVTDGTEKGDGTNYDLPERYDEYGVSPYTDDEYNALVAERDARFFDTVAANLDKTAGGGTTARKAAGSTPDDGEAYTERLRGNIRKILEKKG